MLWMGYLSLGLVLLDALRGGPSASTLVGIGVIAGLATIRGALLNELLELADAINAIAP